MAFARPAESVLHARLHGRAPSRQNFPVAPEEAPAAADATHRPAPRKAVAIAAHDAVVAAHGALR